MATTAHFVLYYPKGEMSEHDVQFLKAEAEYQYAVDVVQNERIARPR